MKKNNDLAALFEPIGLVSNRRQLPTAPIVEEDMTAIILDTAPAECQTALTSEQRVKGTTLTRIDLEEAMNQHWQRIKGKKADKEDEGEEANLSAVTCCECHETCHKANKCPQRRQGPGRGQGRRGEGCGGRGQGRGQGGGWRSI
jgi:hypothetical protein